MPDSRFLQHFVPANPLAGAGVPMPSDLGFAAWSDPPGNCTTSGAVATAAGGLALRRFSMPGAMTITQVHLIINTAGVAMTANQCFVGVWDGNGVLIGLTADQSGNFAGTGLVSLNLLPPGAANGIDTPYAYVGFWYNGTTGPFMVRCATADIALVNGLSAVTPQNARAVTANTGLTTAATVPLNLQAPTKNASTNGPFWCAVS